MMNTLALTKELQKRLVEIVGILYLESQKTVILEICIIELFFA